MEYNLTEAADKIAEKIWDARLMVHGEVPYAELSVDKQNKIKESILPVMFYAFPVVEEIVREKYQKDVEALDEIGKIVSGIDSTDDYDSAMDRTIGIVASTGRGASHG